MRREEQNTEIKNENGWVLTAGGALFILAGVIANMHI
jgi:hypothetical protein